MPGTDLQQRATSELRLTAQKSDLGTVQVSFLYHTIDMRLKEARVFAKELLTAMRAAEQEHERRQYQRVIA